MRRGLRDRGGLTAPVAFHWDLKSKRLAADGVGDSLSGPGLTANTPDNRIICTAHALKQQGKRVVFVSKDINARIKSELGWAPRFPTAHQGVPDAIARLGQPAPAI